MDPINQILSIAANLRTGLNDGMAPAKLLDEKAELLEALSKGDDVEALTEAADITYFAIKSIDWASKQIGVEIETLLAVTVAKYQSRMLFGKDKDLEAKACLSVIKELA